MCVLPRYHCVTRLQSYISLLLLSDGALRRSFDANDSSLSLPPSKSKISSASSIWIKLDKRPGIFLALKSVSCWLWYYDLIEDQSPFRFNYHRQFCKINEIIKPSLLSSRVFIYHLFSSIDSLWPGALFQNRASTETAAFCFGNPENTMSSIQLIIDNVSTG